MAGPGTLPTSKSSCTYGAHTYTEAHSHIHIKINEVKMFKYRNKTTLEIIYDGSIFISEQMPGFSPAAQSKLPICPLGED